MSTSTSSFGSAVWNLPPLILHPFNERIPPSALLENSKAALMLSGLLPNDGTDEEALKKRLLNGRYAEMRMLFFLGRDVFRWVDQCVEWAGRVPEFSSIEMEPQSFASLLTASPPENVRQKLTAWGVADYISIFSRAIGLNAVFAEPPALAALSEEFLRSYHRYADHLFRCYMDSAQHHALLSENFHFELYASGEYSRILENQWSTPE